MNRAQKPSADYSNDTRRAAFGLRALVVLAALLITSVTQAATTWGGEFELARKGVRAADFDKLRPGASKEKQMQLEFVRALQESCAAAGCRITEIKGKWDRDFRVTYPDGFWIKVSYDPGCVEVTFKPSTLEQLRAQAARLNRDVFALAAKTNLGVRADKNSHVNFGVESAFATPQEFLRFFIDYANHPELALGSLGAKDLRNAPPLAALKPEQRAALAQIEIESKSWRWNTIRRAAVAILDRVYTSSFNEKWGNPQHYQALGIKYLRRLGWPEPDQPMELRSVWIQDSAERFILVAELLEARMEYLKRHPDIRYSETARTEFTPTELKTRFAIYVMETGEPFEKYAQLLPPELQALQLDNILSATPDESTRERYADVIATSPWLRARFKAHACRAIFTP